MKESSKSSDKKKKKSHKSDKKSRKLERKAKKEKRKREKALKKRLKDEKKLALEKSIVKTKSEKSIISNSNVIEPEVEYCGPSIDLMNRAKCPETKEQWEHRQSQIKRVVDPDTGRVRLVKGDGEILEEIVPRERHKQINQEATKNDGQTFQLNTVGTASSKYK